MKHLEVFLEQKKGHIREDGLDKFYFLEEEESTPDKIVDSKANDEACGLDRGTQVERD